MTIFMQTITTSTFNRHDFDKELSHFPQYSQNNNATSSSQQIRQDS